MADLRTKKCKDRRNILSPSRFENGLFKRESQQASPLSSDVSRDQPVFANNAWSAAYNTIQDFWAPRLLVKAGVIAQADLEEAIQISSEIGGNVKDLLMRSTFVNGSQIFAAMQAQSMLELGMVEEALMLKALFTACSTGTILEVGLFSVGWAC